MTILTKQVGMAAVRIAVAECELGLQDVLQAFHDGSVNEKLYVEAAQREHRNSDYVDVEPTGVISEGDDDGAWVLGWLWVEASDVWTGCRDGDSQPRRIRNTYHCTACDQEWKSDWSCECDDPCSGCGRSISPTESTCLNLDGSEHVEPVKPTTVEEPVG